LPHKFKPVNAVSRVKAVCPVSDILTHYFSRILSIYVDAGST